MPLSSSDIIILPYDSQFSRAGVQYARDSLHFTFNRMQLNTGERLRKIVAGIAFEMATRRWLESESIRYDRLGATAFTDSDRFDLAIGGRRCDLKSSLIYDKRKIIDLRADPAWVMDAEALVPEDQFESERMGEHDIYVFGFVAGLEARHSTDTEKALAKNLPVCMVHTPTREVWCNIVQWRSLGGVAFKSNADAPIAIEIGGQAANRGAIRERLRLAPRTRVSAKHDYYSVLYLSASQLPCATIALHSPALEKTHVVEPTDWANIWVYGQRVYLCGWMNKHDFRANSRRLPAHSPVKQYRHTATANRALPIGELRPMAELAEIARKHQRV
ncbi:MAG: hypothetical protein FJ030_06355 [Chloroflexi bacterium]|nr:hypothetical protein [Chloroflexota bacterium]